MVASHERCESGKNSLVSRKSQSPEPLTFPFKMLKKEVDSKAKLNALIFTPGKIYGNF